MKLAVIFLASTLASAAALAQPRERGPDGRQRQMAPQRQMEQGERERMREQMRDVYRDRQARPERPRQMTQEERAKLRRDIEETNRDLRRK